MFLSRGRRISATVKILYYQYYYVGTIFFFFFPNWRLVVSSFNLSVFMAKGNNSPIVSILVTIMRSHDFFVFRLPFFQLFCPTIIPNLPFLIYTIFYLVTVVPLETQFPNIFTAYFHHLLCRRSGA